MTKPKRTPTYNVQRKLVKARQEHAAGSLTTDDYIWKVMQCYAAESRHAGK